MYVYNNIVYGKVGLYHLFVAVALCRVYQC